MSMWGLLVFRECLCWVVEAHGKVGDLDAERIAGNHAQFLDARAVAGERVDPAPQARAALFGEAVAALGRARFRSVPGARDQPVVLHLLEDAVDARRVGGAPAKHGALCHLLNDEVAMLRLVRARERRENRGLGQSTQALAELRALVELFFGFRVAGRPH